MANIELDAAHSEPPTRARAAIEADLVTRLQAEFDGYFGEMALFGKMDQAEVFGRLAAMSARASEVRASIMRSESRRVGAFRTRELDPFIEECDRQFRTWSRMVAVRAMEWDISKGGT